MPPRHPISSLDTHAVTNQPPPLVDVNIFAADPVIVAALAREGAAWAEAKARAFGEVLGSERVAELARAADRSPPELRSFDRFGHRLDEVEYHPAYHELMTLAKTHEVHSIGWTARRPGAHVAHMVLEYLLVQADAGVCCPVTMTYASVPAIRRSTSLAAAWEGRITAAAYDPRFVPVAEKTSATIGMAMTEKQGGSDVRANTTRATRHGVVEYVLDGHKWFCSAPMSDAFLTLAQADGGLTCFLVPRWRPDGARNPFHIMRLKDKLGDRSNASSEIELRGTWAERLGEEGDGVRTIIEMVHHTRLDTALAAAGLMRQAVVQAVHHAAHRKAFGRLLLDQPVMRAVLADLTIEWVAATMLAARVARAFDEGHADAAHAPFARLSVALAKYWINRRLVPLVGEALECHGGAGYVEDSVMPRIYRQAPLNGIWEGSGNVICLDVLRTLAREPVALEMVLAEIALARGADRRLDAAAGDISSILSGSADREPQARRIVETLAVALQASLLVRHAPAEVADAFCATRLAGDWGRAFGTLPSGLALDPIIALARVA